MAVEGEEDEASCGGDAGGGARVADLLMGEAFGSDLDLTVADEARTGADDVIGLAGGE